MLLRKCASAAIIVSLLAAWTAVPVFAADFSEITVQAVPRPSMSVAIGAQRVTMLTVRFTASCDRDVHLHSITLHHRGLGFFADIERVYAMVGTVRKTRTAPLTGSEGTVTLRFRGMTVPACSTVSADILADFSANSTASGEHALFVDSRDDIDANSPARILLNPAGAVPLTTQVGRGTGTVSAEFLNIPVPLSYGSARTVARFRLKADGRDDQVLSAITFVNDGTARGNDLENFVLETSGHTVLSSTVPSLDGDRVRIGLNPPLTLHRNEVRLFQLLADIRASRRKTVHFILQEPADLESSPVGR